jgi:aldose 1-epimerase
MRQPTTALEAQHTTGFVIRNGTFEATFHPAAGGRMARLHHVRHGDLLVPLGSEPFHPSYWPKAGAFPLFPFHNKVSGSTFRFDGREIRLKPNMADSTVVMHGPAHRRAWYISDQAEQHIELTLDYKADEDWPFNFKASQRFDLCGDSLTIMLCLTNTGTVTMPGGIGWHPYLQPPADGLICLTAERQWKPFESGDPSVPIHQPTSSIRLEKDSTQHYSGWRQVTARIGESARITLEGSDGLTCLAALRKDEYLCLEPVSHVAGALAHADAPPNDTGMQLLSPGASLSATVRLCVF